MAFTLFKGSTAETVGSKEQQDGITRSPECLCSGSGYVLQQHRLRVTTAVTGCSPCTVPARSKVSVLIYKMEAELFTEKSPYCVSHLTHSRRTTLILI